MPRSSIKSKSSATRKLNAAAKAVKSARATILANRRMSAPPRSGGYYGVGSGELKLIDTGAAAITAVGSGAGASFVTLNGCVPGSDISNRIGRKIVMKSLLGRLSIYPVATTNAPIGDVLRVIIFLDHQTNATGPTATTDVLQTANYQSPLNLANRDRFKVIFDKFFTVNANSYTAGALTTGDPRPVHKKLYKKMTEPTIYNAGTAGTVADITSNSLHMLAITANGQTRLEYNYRVRFIDP